MVFKTYTQSGCHQRLGGGRLAGQIAIVGAFFGTVDVIAGETFIPFQVVPEVGFRSYKPIYEAIKTQDEWAAFWTSRNTDSLSQAATMNVAPVPAIDFKKYTLLVASSGMKPNAGHSLAFISIREINGVIEVSVLDFGPAVNCPTEQVITNPRIFALIPKSERPIHFEVLHAAVDCARRE